MSEENKNVQKVEQEESSIDFLKIFNDLKKHKNLYFKVLPIAFLLAAIYSLSLPNYYQCEVVMSPELSTRRSTNSLASLASSMGINLGANMAGNSEALFPTVYPELINSVAFHTTLFPIKVHRDKDPKMMTYYDYLLNDQKSPWWTEAKAAVFKGIASLFGKEKKKEKTEIDPFRLTKKQMAIVKSMRKRIVCDVDKKTMMITINVTDQDPLIAATMADSVQQRLQDFITDYRTKKARKDYEYAKKIYSETKERYDKARHKYANFSDANRKVFLETVRSEQTSLSNELNIQYQVYAQASAQMQQAEADVQRETPAFAILQPATVPVQKAGPARAKICLIFVFLAFLGTSVYILHKEDDLKQLLGLS